MWQRTFVAGGASPAPPVLGDVNGDGHLDVVITGRDGGIWALEAATGKDLPHFPVRTGGRIMAPTTLLRLVLDGDRAAWAAAESQRRTSAAAAAAATVDPSAASALRSADGMATASGGGHNAGLQIIVPCFDGHVYVVAGATGCTNKIDIGEHSYVVEGLSWLHAPPPHHTYLHHRYAAVLADDLSEDGLLELVVSTMNGNVMAFSTSTPAEPLNTQPTLPLGAKSQRLLHSTAQHRVSLTTTNKSCLLRSRLPPQLGMGSRIAHIGKVPCLCKTVTTIASFQERKCLCRCVCVGRW